MSRVTRQCLQAAPLPFREFTLYTMPIYDVHFYNYNLLQVRYIFCVPFL